jgi:hypothetical protein
MASGGAGAALETIAEESSHRGGGLGRRPLKPSQGRTRTDGGAERQRHQEKQPRRRNQARAMQWNGIAGKNDDGEPRENEKRRQSRGRLPLAQHDRGGGRGERGATAKK